MLLLVAIFLGVLTVPLTGGRVSMLAHVRLRFVPAIFVALFIQVMITAVVTGAGWVDRLLYVVSYGFAALFLIGNRKITGIWVVAAGTTLNALAIVANGGVMPASASAVRSAGLATNTHGFLNSAAVAHPHLLVFGDVLAIPASLPLHNVYSIGDICIAIGAVIAIHSLSRVRADAQPVRAEAHSELRSPDTSTSR